MLDADKNYDCDESSFQTDQTNRKCVTVKGERAFQLCFGFHWDNIAFLAVADAADFALDQLIIFKGKRLMEAWFGTSPLPNTITVNLIQRHLPNGLKNFARISRSDHCY